MSMKLSPLISNVHFPPISEVKRWLAERPHDGGLSAAHNAAGGQIRC
jgi:hypothetical protein